MSARFPARFTTRSTLLALLVLPGSMAMVFPAMLLSNNLAPSFADWAGPYLFHAYEALFCTIGGFVWGTRLARLCDAPSTRRWGAAAALGYGLSAPIASASLTAAETYLLNRAQEGHPEPMHLAFAAAFGGAIAIVVGLASFALGTAASGRFRGGLRIALLASGLATAAFVAVDALFDLAGWRVGAPHAEERFTMMVVLAAALLAATATGGAVLGTLLRREVWRRDPTSRPDSVASTEAPLQTAGA
jgi:hypothetical protein